MSFRKQNSCWSSPQWQLGLLIRVSRSMMLWTASACSKRTAQRMLRALEDRFLDTQSHFDDEGRKRWRLPSEPCEIC